MADNRIPPPSLTESTSINDTDLLVVWPEGGPLNKISGLNFLESIGESLATTGPIADALAAKEPTIPQGTDTQLIAGDKTLVNMSSLPISTATQAALDGKESLTNKTQVIDSDSTSDEYPSAEAVFDLVDPISRGRVRYDIAQLLDAADTLRAQQNVKALPNVLNFGAKGDGVTDDTAAFAASLGLYGVAIVPADKIYVVNELNLNAGNEIYGVGGGAVIVGLTDSEYIFGVNPFTSGSSFKDPIRIRNLDINMIDNSDPDSCAIRGLTSLGNVFNVRISECNFIGCFKAFADEVHATNYLVDVFFTDVNCTFTRGLQIDIKRSRGFVTLFDVRVDHTYNTGQVTWGGISLHDVIGVEVYKSDVVGPVIPEYIYQPTSIAFELIGTSSRSASFWINRLLVDNTRGSAIYIANMFNGQIDNVMAYQNGGEQIQFVNCVDIQISNILAHGMLTDAGVIDGAADNASGIIFNGCKNISIANIQAEYNTGHGVVRADCERMIFGCLAAKVNKGFGIVDAGTSDRNVIRSGNFEKNVRTGTSPSFSYGNDGFILGDDSAVCSYIDNAGTYTSETMGSASGVLI